MSELDILRSVNFEWTLHLKSIWSDEIYDVPRLHRPVRDEIIDKAKQLSQSSRQLTPIGEVIVGIGGTGKTHLLSSIRKAIFEMGQWFVLVDMIDVRDFEETVLLGYIDSLQTKYTDTKLQYEVVLERFLEKGGIDNISLEDLGGCEKEDLIAKVTDIIRRLRHVYHPELRKYQDVFRALIYFHSYELSLSDIGYNFLIGLEMDDEEKRHYGFSKKQENYITLYEALSWIMSAGGVTVLALDQLDAIVTQHHLASGSGDQAHMNDEQKRSLAIINGIGGGLSTLYGKTRRTVIVVSCLELTWEILKNNVLSPSIDRYGEPKYLKEVNHSTIAEQIIANRLSEAFERHQFKPRYTTWPFHPTAIQALVDITPREILKKCDKERNRLLRRGRVEEITTFGEKAETIDLIVPDNPAPIIKLNQQYREYKRNVSVEHLLNEKNDEEMAKAIQSAYEYLLLETEFPANVDVHLDRDFPTDKNYAPLHTRLRLVFMDQDDREEHYCIRALLHNHANSYLARLKAAMAASGIDQDLSFRYLRLIRDKPTPNGYASQKLTEAFKQHNGRFINPSIDDLRAIVAISYIKECNESDFRIWLRKERPVTKLSIMEDTVKWLKEKLGFTQPAAVEDESSVKKETYAGTQADLEETAGESHVVKESVSEQEVKETAGESFVEAEVSEQSLEVIHDIPIGHRYIGGEIQDELRLKLAALTKHTVLLAGSGSGKTVLIKRLIEEAALAGIPSIVIDAANDLARLGEPWPNRPQSWSDDDAEKAEYYFKKVETVIWTPARETGNPMTLSPLPDFAAVQDNQDEMYLAVELAKEALKDTLAPGATPKAQKKLGILSAALEYYARRGGQGLKGFIELLADLPAEASDISNAEKLSLEMADQMRAAIHGNPLLKETGTLFDPSILFGDASSTEKTRISVLNFIGLPGLESQQVFINQLAMTLFTWVKKHPAPGNRLLRGLLVIDEAKDFVPSGKSTPCKASMNRLVAQARKYGLGLIFATQTPKSIDHNIVANCSNHFYGHANSPTAIETIADQIRQRGGSGHDVSRLGTGVFYVYSETLNDEAVKAPVKMKAPLCLSFHPSTPLSESDVLRRARESCEKIGGPKMHTAHF